LDNYSDEELFPIHFNWSDNKFNSILGEDWTMFTFDDSNWCGNGTKIAVRHFPQV
jgi:hypothetical protein